MDRNFAKLHEDVCFQRAGGQIIWQPRIGCWIDDKLFEKGELPGIYKGLSKVEIYKELDCSARVYEYNSCFQPKLDETIHTRKEVNGRITRFTVSTPKGNITQELQSTPNSWAMLFKKNWVTCEEDLKIFTYIEEHTDWTFSMEEFNRVKAEWGDLGAPTIFMPRVNMQRLYIDVMGVEEAVYAVYDYPETVEKYFAALHESQMRLIDVINRSPVNIINFGDNIHSGTLSPELFEKYVLPEYQIRTDKLRQGGKFTCSHFDGDNRGLMQYYQSTGLDGIEAITPLPQGDVDLKDVRKYLGDKMFLLDGIPAVYFDDTYSEQTLIDCTHEVIDLFAPHLILGISDEISSTGDIERIRTVGKIVDEYNEKILRK